MREDLHEPPVDLTLDLPELASFVERALEHNPKLMAYHEAEIHAAHDRVTALLTHGALADEVLRELSWLRIHEQALEWLSKSHMAGLETWATRGVKKVVTTQAARDTLQETMQRERDPVKARWIAHAKSVWQRNPKKSVLSIAGNLMEKCAEAHEQATPHKPETVPDHCCVRYPETEKAYGERRIREVIAPYKPPRS